MRLFQNVRYVSLAHGLHEMMYQCDCSKTSTRPVWLMIFMKSPIHYIFMLMQSERSNGHFLQETNNYFVQIFFFYACANRVMEI